jgi:hypothetical protein
MDAAMQAAPPKPAIAADPGPSASAPRNGNSGAAPTTVQSVPSAGGHQATQASSAQRSAGGPANGGAPAGTQATKRASNGKEDDEDWWTE